MKTRIFIFLFLTSSLISNIIYAQFMQQGPKLLGDSTIGAAGQDVCALSSDGNTAVLGGASDNGGTGAVWIFTRSGGVWQQQGSKLIGTGSIGFAKQGSSVAISSDGNTVVVGGFHDNGNIGAIWVFTRSGGVWSQQGPKLVGSGAIGSSWQGSSVSLSSDGKTAIVGGFNDNSSTGAVWIFTRIGSTWVQQGLKIVGSGAVGFAHQGGSVSVSSDGNTLVEGGSTDNSSTGACWVFTRSGSTWSQQGSKLVGSGAAGFSAQGSVAISSDGNTFVIGGHSDNGNIGAVWIFTRSGSSWSQQDSKLTGTGAAGSAGQGGSVAISSDGNSVVIGGSSDNGSTGAVWVFVRNNSTWWQLGPKLVGTGEVGFGNMGVSAAISGDGNTIIAGGELDNGGIGADWVFARSNYRYINSHHIINKIIQGNQVTYDTINVATDISSYYISNVNVSLDSITYPVDSDLEISLIHATVTDTLVYQAGGNGANFIGTMLSDSATALISNGTAPFSGNFKPVKPLSQFINFDPSGIWILKIYNRNTGHTGILEGWTLTIDLVTGPISVHTISTMVPNDFALYQNYPNPFNPSTNISFAISKTSFVKLVIYDVLGRVVETLINEDLKTGTYQASWNASGFTSGVYFYVLRARDYSETKKMILIK